MGVMPSEHRFHPLTVLFALGGELRNFLAPIVFATFTAQSRGGDMQNWFLIFMIPSVVIATSRYWFSTYRYAETELVVRTGIFFKNERHIPYARIQSVDAKQNVVHRFFKVVDVVVQTGTGGDAEATLSVLPFEALEHMRMRVFEGKRAAAEGEPEQSPQASDQLAVPTEVPPAPPGEVILHLPLRETALSGLLDNRGWVVIGAASGLFWESGFVERYAERFESWQSLAETSWAIVVAVAAGLFVVSPILSAVMAAVRLHGFTLTRRGEELLTQYGALTRVTGTVPLRRVQAVKVVRSPGQLLTGRASIRLETAGGDAQSTSASDWVAPIIHDARVPDFVNGLLPDVRLGEVEWRPADAHAGQRRMRLAVYVALVAGAFSALWLEWQWAAAVTAVMAAWGVIGARQYVRNLGWSRTEHAIYFRSGWLWKSITIVPVPKVQAVTLQESPFDRRWQMASVAVDTAGAGAHAVDVPYLPRAVAEDLRVTLATQAAATTYRW